MNAYLIEARGRLFGQAHRTHTLGIAVGWRERGEARRCSSSWLLLDDRG